MPLGSCLASKYEADLQAYLHHSSTQSCSSLNYTQAHLFNAGVVAAVITCPSRLYLSSLVSWKPRLFLESGRPLAFHPCDQVDCLIDQAQKIYLMLRSQCIHLGCPCAMISLKQVVGLTFEEYFALEAPGSWAPAVVAAMDRDSLGRLMALPSSGEDPERITDGCEARPVQEPELNSCQLKLGGPHAARYIVEVCLLMMHLQLCSVADAF